jgi:hypothetical protein
MQIFGSLLLITIQIRGKYVKFRDFDQTMARPLAAGDLR